MVVTCPFCFRQFPSQEMRFRCLNSECRGMAPDADFASARGYGPTPMGRVLVPSKRALGRRGGVSCDACGVMSTTRICPFCHQELSQDVGQLDHRIIAIIGGRATGKTHYIASLIARLQNEVALNFDIHVRMIGDETNRRWKNDFYTPLFIHKKLLAPNRPAALDASVRSPLMFRFTFGDDSRLRALNVSFFDAAGEDMKSLSKMSVYNRYICYADGIIFLLDPLQIPSVRFDHRMASANLPLEDPDASPEYIINNLRDLFEREQRLGATQKVKVPIAFTLSKVDTLKPILDRVSALGRPSNHPGVLNYDDVQSVNTEISDYLAGWINPSFMIGVRRGFEHFNFFGVSALGNQPDANDQLTTISPLRVEDPFLWLLRQLNLINERKGL